MQGDHLDIDGRSVNLEQAISDENGSDKPTTTLISFPLLLVAVEASYDVFGDCGVILGYTGCVGTKTPVVESRISSRLRPYKALDNDGTFNIPFSFTKDSKAGVIVSDSSIVKVPIPCGKITVEEGI